MPKRLPKDDTIIDINPDSVENITELDLDIQDQADLMFAEVGIDERDEQFLIRIYKVVEKTGKRATCFTVVPSEMPGITDRLQKEYGGGLYDFWFYKNNQLIKRKGQAILEPRKDAVIDIKNDMAAVMQTIVDSNKQQFEQLKELMLMQMQQKQQIGPVTAPQGPNMLEMFQGMGSMMATLKGLMPQSAQGGSEFETMLKTLEVVKGMDIGGNGAEKNGWDGLTEIVKHAMPSLMDMTGKISEANALNAATQAQQPVPQPVPQPLPHQLAPDGAERHDPNTHPVNRVQNSSLGPGRTDSFNKPQETQDVNMVQKAMFTKSLDAACMKAAEGADPGLYADLLLDNWNILPEEIAEQLLNSEDPVTDLAAVHAPVNNQRAWFTQVLDQVKEVIADEAEADAKESMSESEDLPYTKLADINGPINNQRDLTDTEYTVNNTTESTEPVTDEIPTDPPADPTHTPIDT